MAKKEKTLSGETIFFSGRTLDKLYEAYDEARRTAKEADAAKSDAAYEIKQLLGETEEASTPNYTVTYKYDKDSEREVFDGAHFEEKDPKGYTQYQNHLDSAAKLAKKYTKTEIVKGARKLVVTALAE